jgi:hypothetical protein
LLIAVHVQPFGAVTRTDSSSPEAAAVAAVGEMLKLQPGDGGGAGGPGAGGAGGEGGEGGAGDSPPAACSTAMVTPASKTLPERSTPGFALTSKVIAAEP